MRILGIDLGSWSIKAVEMESRFRRFDVLDFHEVRLPLQILNPITEYKQAVEQLLARLPSHPEKVVTSLPPTQAAIRFLMMPVKQRKQVEKMYRFELEDQVPFKLDESIVEHSVSRVKEQSLIMAAIAPKNLIQGHIQWLKSIGIDPDWLTFDGMGIINLFLSSLKSDEVTDATGTGPTLLLDIGHLKTNAAITNEGQVEYFRSLVWGGMSITQSIATYLSITPEEAELSKGRQLDFDKEEGSLSPDEAELLDAAAQAIRPLLTDLNHTLVAYRNLYKQEVRKVVITGGTAKLKGIVNLLGKTLKMDVQEFHPFAQLGLEEKKNADEFRFGESLGRALVFARKVNYLFNFRQQEAGKETSLTEIAQIFKNPNVILLGKLASILFVILFVHLFFAGMVAKREALASVEELRKVFAQTFPSVPTKIRNSLTTSPQQLKKFIEQKNTELEKKLKMVSQERVPVIGLIRDISDAFPGQVKVDVNELQINDRNFSIAGVLYSGDIGQITESIKKIPSFKNVVLDQKGQRFTYRGEIAGR